MGSKCSVLAVADPPALAVLKDILEKDFDVTTAAAPAEARRLLDERDFDIVLADQHVPDAPPDVQSGVHLLEWVRRQRPATICVLLAEPARLQETLDAANRRHIHRFVIKPVKAQCLLETLREAARTVLIERSHEELLDELRRLNQELEERVRQRTRELEESNRQLQSTHSILEKMALTDPLTGLPNRRAMDRLVRTELQRRLRHPAAIALMIVDADHFKDINTCYLLPGGDHVLIWLAQMLAQNIRTIDSVGRIGGEEFLVLAPNTPGDGAAALAERLRKAIEQGSTVYNDKAIQLTVSIGAAVAEQDVPATYEQLRDLAAEALAEAKRTGRNRCVIRAVPPRHSA